MATPQSKWRVTNLPGMCPSGLTKDQRPHEPIFCSVTGAFAKVTQTMKLALENFSAFSSRLIVCI